MATVTGWIYESNLHELVQRIAAYVGYRWDDLDTWFQYPIVGDPPVILALARSNGHLHVRISGMLDPVLIARFETLLDVY